MDGNGSIDHNPRCACAPHVDTAMPRLPMCRCGNYPRTTVQGDCTVCGAGFYESFDEWRDCINAESAGFVESDGDKEYPVTVCVFLNTHDKENAREYVKVSNVREDSITIEERKGIRTLVCESAITQRIAYIPFVVWYTTELQSGVHPS